MLKTVLAAAIILFVSTAHAITPTPLTPDCSKTIEYEKNLLDNGYQPMMTFTDGLNEDTLEDFLYNKSKKSVVIISRNSDTKQVCLMLYTENTNINPDINIFRDFIDDHLNTPTDSGDKTP